TEVIELRVEFHCLLRKRIGVLVISGLRGIDRRKRQRFAHEIIAAAGDPLRAARFRLRFAALMFWVRLRGGHHTQHHSQYKQLHFELLKSKEEYKCPQEPNA